MSSTTSARGWLRVAPAVLVLAWGGNHFIPLMQLYRRIDGYDQLQVDLTLAVYVVGIVPGFALSGAWSDRFGRKPLLFVGLAIGVVASAVLALASGSLVGLCVGRLLSGLSVGAAMVVGSSWIKELSVASGHGSAGARRASIALSIGFGGGAGVAGALAQWAPFPTLLPYVAQIAACLVAAVLLTTAADTREADPAVTSLLGDLRVPRAARPQFLRAVVPVAPWVFGASALAFAVGPSLVATRVGSFTVGFATLATVVTLGTGTAVQLLSAPIGRALRGRSGPAGVLLCAAGALVLIAAVVGRSPAAVLVAAPLFGAGYGLCMVTGLAITQSLATGRDLAGLTAVFYAVSYSGFFLPMILAALEPLVGYGVGLGAVAVVCCACAAFVLRAGRPSTSG